MLIMFDVIIYVIIYIITILKLHITFLTNQLSEHVYLKPILLYHYDLRSCFEAVPTKKKEKKTLETFLEKPQHPNPFHLTILAYSERSGSPRSEERRSYKKERKKNVRNVLRETPTPKPISS